MVIRYLDIKCITALPFKTDSPLIVNSNTILPFSVADQLFKAIRGRNPQVVDVEGVVDHAKFTQCHLLNIHWQFARTLTLMNSLSFSVFEGFDHKTII